MTLDELIEKLTALRAKHHGGLEVLALYSDGATFVTHSVEFNDDEGEIIFLNVEEA